MSDIIASISGIRGVVGQNFTPQNIVKYTSAFAEYCRNKSPIKKNQIVIGRDGRLHGDKISNIVVSNLLMYGFKVTNIGVAPTPTIQIATEELSCCGGISITASHNPQIWNGLKFLNPNGTFLDENQVRKYLRIALKGKFTFADVRDLKLIRNDFSWIDRHIDKVLKIKIIDIKKIRSRKFRIVVDAVNASGSVIIPRLLEKFGCKVIKLFCDESGHFPHTPEPLPENLILLSRAVKRYKADLGIAVDPDADRLVIITDKGEAFGEENTITTVVSFVLKKTNSKKNKNVTVNLSTTRAVDDIVSLKNGKVHRSPVGEINVVKEMIRNKSIVGGEGSGGIIYPELHYGRDSLAGIALILNEFADFYGKVSEYKEQLPQYYISKTKIDNISEPEKILEKLRKKYYADKNVVNVWNIDGLKIEFKYSWIHMRKSNTEPVIRIITEARTKEEAENLQKFFLRMIRNEIKN